MFCDDQLHSRNSAVVLARRNAITAWFCLGLGFVLISFGGLLFSWRLQHFGSGFVVFGIALGLMSMWYFRVSKRLSLIASSRRYVARSPPSASESTQHSNDSPPGPQTVIPADYPSTNYLPPSYEASVFAESPPPYEEAVKSNNLIPAQHPSSSRPPFVSLNGSQQTSV